MPACRWLCWCAPGGDRDRSPDRDSRYVGTRDHLLERSGRSQGSDKPLVSNRSARGVALSTKQVSKRALKLQPSGMLLPKASTKHLVDEVEFGIRELMMFDEERLCLSLETGEIRLLRAKWLRRQGADYRIQRRQDLEQLQPSPFLSGKEAVQILRAGKRGIGVLTYGWSSPDGPDGTGHCIDLLRRALQERRYIEAVFWDL